MQKSSSLFLVIFTLLFITGCKKEEDFKPAVEAAMTAFASSLQNNLPTSSSVSTRVRTYLDAQPNYFFGSTVTLLDANGLATTSPYSYRINGVVLIKELVVPSYKIDTQVWLRKAIDLKQPYWTEPYFDAGGGDIWMQTYSVPIIINNKVVAVATTDLAVNKP
jgi:sigma-B regulation protein RsbU (phosphoserine phosphatase)